MIILYTTDCPKCRILEQKMNEKNVQFVKNTSVKEMLALGFAQAPMLSIDGKLLNFTEANDWINNK